jgi:hypothetical protein
MRFVDGVTYFTLGEVLPVDMWIERVANAKADLSGYTMERLLFRERTLARTVDFINKNPGFCGHGAHDTLVSCWSMLWQTRDAIRGMKAERFCALQRLPLPPGRIP